MRRLVYTPAARSDLEDILRFIAADNPRRARLYVGEIQEACRRLRDMPDMGMARPDLRPKLRVLPLWRRIVVAYEPSGSTIDVLRIFSAGQDYEALMTGD